MTDTLRRRGRPKGTGIDDTATLIAIASLIAANAGLRPTSAIRRTGISDPSVVRRLRDKLKAAPAVPASLAQKQGGPDAATAPAHPIDDAQQPHVTTSQASPAPPSDATQPSSAAQTRPPWPQNVATSNAAPPPPRDSAAKAASAPQGSPFAVPAPLTRDPQLEALRLSAEAAAAMSRLYLHCLTHAAHANPLSLALRSQIVMSQFLASMFASDLKPSLGRKTG